jgi:aldose 1-epimerase
MARQPFGILPDGGGVEVHAFTNANGVEVRAMSYGATVVSIRTPDRHGQFDDVVLGFDAFDDYLTKARYFGSIVGRYGNRIAGGRFMLDGSTVQLTVNGGANHLHGGKKGFDRAIWQGEPFERPTGNGVTFTHTSPDGEEGYPGTLNASVTYTLTPRNELVLEYVATTDRATPINLTNHSYFNLTGRGRGDILQHQLTLHAGHYLPTDASQIPTGEIASVTGTPFDFRTPVAIGARIDAEDEQIRRANGYDHNFVIDDDARLKGSHSGDVSSRSGDVSSRSDDVGSPSAAGVAFARPVAHVADPVSGRTLDVATTEPGVQFYSGNKLDFMRNGFGRRTAFCLETQHFPDSPNRAAFPSTILRPGDTYRSKTVYSFGVMP